MRDVVETDDDPIYRAKREFSPAALRSGYAIPVPPGRYRLSVLCAETYYTGLGLSPAGGPRRRFDVVVENTARINDIDGRGARFAEPAPATFTVEQFISPPTEGGVIGGVPADTGF